MNLLSPPEEGLGFQTPPNNHSGVSASNLEASQFSSQFTRSFLPNLGLRAVPASWITYSSEHKGCLCPMVTSIFHGAQLRSQLTGVIQCKQKNTIVNSSFIYNCLQINYNYLETDLQIIFYLSIRTSLRNTNTFRNNCSKNRDSDYSQ